MRVYLIFYGYHPLKLIFLLTLHLYSKNMKNELYIIYYSLRITEDDSLSLLICPIKDDQLLK